MIASSLVCELVARFRIAVPLAVLALCSACDEPASAKKPQTAGAPPLVVVAAVEAADVPIEREYVARTEADDTVEITARVEAPLETMEFEEGKPVAKDQVLYRLDRRTFDANLASAKAKLAKAEADLKLAEEQVSVRVAEANLEQARAENGKADQDVARLEPLAAQDAVPKQDLDTAIAAQKVAIATVNARDAALTNAQITEAVAKLYAHSAVDAAKAEVALSELDIEYCTIKAPMSGLIGRSEVSVGNLVGRGDATVLATLSSIDPMLVTFALDESEVLDLLRRRAASGAEKPEVEMELVLADTSLYPHKGKFRSAEREIALETGTIQIVAEFPNPDAFLRPGQFGRVRLSSETLVGALLVPQRAVMEQQGTKGVLVVDGDGKVALRSIRTSERYKDFFVVTEGVKAGDRIVVEGQMKARPGQVVQISTKPAAGEPNPAAKQGG